MEPILNSESFELLVTHVEKEHGLVKVFGQVDLQTSQVVEKYLSAVREQLEGGSAPQLVGLQVGQVIVARRDRGWYRGKVVALDSASRRVVVFLLDHGLTIPLPVVNIRTGVHSQLSQVQPLAVSFFLGEVVPPGGDWSKPAIEFISDAVVGVGVCKALVTHRGHGHNFIRLYTRNSREPLSQDMVQCGMAVSGLPNIDYLPPAQNYVQPQTRAPAPYQAAPQTNSGHYPPPLAVRVPPLPPPEYQPSQPPPSVIFRPMHLEIGQWYPVYLSSTEGGPGDFCIQLESLSKKLEEVMMAANNTTLRPIPAHSIQAGVPCLARYSLDSTIYRAVVLKKDSSAKVYYLDYGNSEQVALDKVYSLPSDQLATQMLSVRCSIYQWPQLSAQDKQRAKLRLETYCDRVVQCRVVSTETGGSFASARTLVQLYEDGQDIGQEIRLWLARPTDEFRPGPAGDEGFGYLTLTGGCDVYLVHPDHGPLEFYVSRVDTSAALASVMREIHEMSQNGKLFPLNSAKVGSPCLARYTDGVWYRAIVQGVSYDRTEVTVFFVDYGNSSTVPLTSVGVIPPSLVSCLPAQAVQCRLSGLHNTNADITDKWTNIITEKIKIKVEGVDCGVHVVQATTLPAPGVNINQEVCTRGGERRGATLSVGDVEEMQVTWVESSNSFYGQLCRSRQELRDMLARLSDNCQRSGQLLYRDNRDHHSGEMCAVMDSRSKGKRYLRGVIVKEHKENVEIRLMDVGGKERVAKSQVLSLPREYTRKPEFGVICSFGCNPCLTDNKLKDVLYNSVLEVRIAKKIGDGVEVTVSKSKSRKVNNNQVMSVLESLITGDSKLNQLYEKQNNKMNSKLNGYQSSNGNSEAPMIERGDLRNSLREKRAARDREQQRAMLESDRSERGGKGRPVGLGLTSFKPGWRGECRIPWMYSPAHFYIQVDRDRRQFEEMMRRLQDAMVTRRQESWRVGQVVAGRWSDDCWYRGQVVNIKHGKMEIFFVDFGNTEKVDRDDVGSLPSEFCSLDCQAVRVRLDGIDAEADRLDDGKFTKYFDQEIYKAEILSLKDKDGAYLIQLNNGEIAKALMTKDPPEDKKKKQKKDKKEKESSSETDSKTEKSGKQKKEKKEKSKAKDEEVDRGSSFASSQEEKLSKTAKLRKAGKLFTVGDYPGVVSSDLVGKNITATLSSAKSWKDVWLQVKRDVALEMKERLNAGDNKDVIGKVVKSIEEGECCVVEHEGAWYRASVLEKLDGGSNVRVLLVDWGHSIVLPLTSIWDGDFALYDSPPAAINCKLDTKVDNMDKLTDTTFTVRVKSFKDNMFIVKLDKKSGKRDSRDETRQEVVVVHVESVSKVCVVEKENMARLEQIMADLAKIDTVKKANIAEDDWCCVRFSEDDQLYRATVTDVSQEDGTVCVKYIDYGNAEDVTNDDILELPANLKESPPLAKCVRVKNAEFALDSEANRNKLEKALGGEKVSAVMKDSGEAVFYLGTNKLDLTKVLGCNKNGTINIFHQAECPRVSCHVSHAERDHVWLRSDESDVLEVGNRIQECLQDKSRRQNKAGKVQVGDLVIARFSQDRKYYRAKVVQQMGSHKVEVMFIDYGNTELVETGWLKSLPAEFRLCPGLAMRCSLETEEETRLVSGPELLQLSQLTADLVHPRHMVVTLWHRGHRLGLTGQLTLPTHTLRLGDTWLGLLCSTSTTKTMSVLNISQAMNIKTLMDFYRTNIDVSGPVEGRLYSRSVNGVERRVMVRSCDLSRGVTTLSSVDTAEVDKVPTNELTLQSLVPRLQSHPAAVTACSPHEAKDTKYLVPDTLVMVNVADSNNLKLVQVRLKVSAKYSQTPVDNSNLKLNLDAESDSILSVELPTGKWSSDNLSQVRDALLMSSLGLQQHPVSSRVKEVEFPEKTDPVQQDHRVSELIGNDNSYHFNNSLPQIDGDNIRVQSHPLLPPQEFKKDCVSKFKVIALDHDDKALVEAASPPNSMSNKDLKPATSVEIGQLYGLVADDKVKRVSVIKVDNEIAEAFDIDTGVETICHHSELLELPKESLSAPPSVMTVRLVTEDVITPGDTITGSLRVSEDNKEVELITRVE